MTENTQNNTPETVNPAAEPAAYFRDLTAGPSFLDPDEAAAAVDAAFGLVPPPPPFREGEPWRPY